MFFSVNWNFVQLCELVSLQRYTKALTNLQRASLVEKSRQKPQERMSVLSNVKCLFKLSTFEMQHFFVCWSLQHLFFCRLWKLANMIMSQCCVHAAFLSVLTLLKWKVVCYQLLGYISSIFMSGYFILPFFYNIDWFAFELFNLFDCFIKVKIWQWRRFFPTKWAVEF